MKTSSLSLIGAALWSFSLSTQFILAQGSLIPPGPPTPTMKTLDQIEPRTPISHLPYTISKPGAYYLTTNLAANPGGIGIWTNNVTLDLMGFELNGEGGSSAGIAVIPGVVNIRIRNGAVTGWLYDGVNTAGAMDCVLQDLRASKNGGDGLEVGNASVVRNCASSLNGRNGILGNQDCSLHDCIVSSNSNHGIVLGGGANVRNCLTMHNASMGLNCSDFATIQDCTATFNGSEGIHVADSGKVTGCTASGNAQYGIACFGAGGLVAVNCVANLNHLTGIILVGGSVVKGCVANQNSLHGIEALGDDSAIADCSADFNHGTGILLGQRGTLSGCSVSYNSTNGIIAQANSTIVGCTVSRNKANGIQVTANANRIDGNNVTENGNDGIFVAASATKNVVVRNVASGNANFQYRVPGLPNQPPAGANAVGAVVSDPTNPNANAWANFSP